MEDDDAISDAAGGEFASCREKPLPAKIRIRVPAWAAKDMPIYVNGSLAATGKPGTYAVLDRTWADKDAITFTLPITFRLTRYTGADQAEGAPRYGLEYGPILMAVIGSPDSVLQVKGGKYAEDLLGQISAKAGTPLHFASSSTIRTWS